MCMFGGFLQGKNLAAQMHSSGADTKRLEAMVVCAMMHSERQADVPNDFSFFSVPLLLCARFGKCVDCFLCVHIRVHFTFMSSQLSFRSYFIPADVVIVGCGPKLVSENKIYIFAHTFCHIARAQIFSSHFGPFQQKLLSRN